MVPLPDPVRHRLCAGMTQDIVIVGLDPAIQPVSIVTTTGLDYPVKPGNDDEF